MENSKEKIKITIPKCNKDIYTNVVYAVTAIAYFISLNIVYMNCETKIFEMYIKISYIVYLILAIIIYEIAYKKDSGKLAIYGIEYMLIAIYILLIQRIVNALKLDMHVFIVTSSYIFPIYYLYKAVIIDTIQRRNKLKQLSDIEEITKKEKPSKKLAKKRKV